MGFKVGKITSDPDGGDGATIIELIPVDGGTRILLMTSNQRVIDDISHATELAIILETPSAG